MIQDLVYHWGTYAIPLFKDVNFILCSSVSASITSLWPCAFKIKQIIVEENSSQLFFTISEEKKRRLHEKLKNQNKTSTAPITDIKYRWLLAPGFWATDQKNISVQSMISVSWIFNISDNLGESFPEVCRNPDAVFTLPLPHCLDYWKGNNNNFNTSRVIQDFFFFLNL